MQREIKFRAWDTAQKKMFYSTSVDNNGDWCSDVDYINLCENIDNKKIQLQFTGLHDKNGKEIWEGDIVTWGNGNAVITYGGKIWIDDGREEVAGFIAEDCLLNSECRVLGNIYSNPELLEETK